MFPMKEIKDKKAYALVVSLIASTCVFSVLGYHWNCQNYHYEEVYNPSNPPVSIAMMGLHDGLIYDELDKLYHWTFTEAAIAHASEINATQESILSQIQEDKENKLFADGLPQPEQVKNAISDFRAEDEATVTSVQDNSVELEKTYEFTTATEDYFADAVFIGDSRTVGICEYAGIENATFLCKTSLTIYDYDKPKIMYNAKKTSIKEVLSTNTFAKIYLMLGINECGYGSADSYYEQYKAVVDDIRSLQPDALIFIEGNLLVTEEKSHAGGGINNTNLSARNEAISRLANQKDIFYIDINESTLCQNDALVSEYTWDHVHIKAQYYPIWKEFLLSHAIIKDTVEHTDDKAEEALINPKIPSQQKLTACRFPHL